MKSDQFESPTKIKKFPGIMTPPVIKNTNPKIKSQWNRLYVNRQGRMHSPEEAIRQEKKMKTESVQIASYYCNLNPYDVQHYKAKKKREATRQRIKKNQEIYYQKKTYSEKCSEHHRSTDKSPIYASVSEFNLPQDHSNKYELNKPICIKEGNLPFMLQRRKKKIDKQLSIIQHLSIENIKKLKGKQQKKQQINHQQKLKLLNKMKGTKIYYNFVRQWKAPVFSDQQQMSPSKDM